jgi:hypothetical protein
MPTTTRFRVLDPGRCGVATLTSEECWRLLERKTFGRVAIADGRRVEIVPVAYDALEQTIVVRSAPETKLALLAEGADVAFEVDGGDDEGVVRWSIVVNGSARGGSVDDAVTSTTPSSERDAPGSERRTSVAIAPVSITGRAFRAVPADDREDRRTMSRVRHALRRTRQVDATRVRVVAEAGFVTLFGEVGSVAESLSATQAAREVPGVLGVEDLMTFRRAQVDRQLADVAVEVGAASRREVTAPPAHDVDDEVLVGSGSAPA